MKQVVEHLEKSKFRRWRAGGLDFRSEGTTLCFRQAGPIAAFYIGMGLAGTFMICFVEITSWTQLNPKETMAAAMRWLPLFLAPMPIGILIWAVRARAVPFCLDFGQDELRRGRWRLCALSSIKGVRVVRVQSGRGPMYHAELALNGKSDTIRLPEALTAQNARLAAEELARCLNVLCLPEIEGSMF